MKDSSTKMVSSTWFSLASILGDKGSGGSRRDGQRRGPRVPPSPCPSPSHQRSLVDVAFEVLQLLALGGRDHLLDLLQLRLLGTSGLHGRQDGFHPLRLLQQPPGGTRDSNVVALPPPRSTPRILTTPGPCAHLFSLVSYWRRSIRLATLWGKRKGVGVSKGQNPKWVVKWGRCCCHPPRWHHPGEAPAWRGWLLTLSHGAPGAGGCEGVAQQPPSLLGGGGGGEPRVVMAEDNHASTCGGDGGEGEPPIVVVEKEKNHV